MELWSGPKDQMGTSKQASVVLRPSVGQLYVPLMH